ncbi:MAG: hypothetical protein H8E11_03215 [Candidatus Cloacimonetes bacterium]|nr:hypothetical protein [Candidatus Cloacimonadota bacterium]
MKENKDLFHDLLLKFHIKGVLENVILIGSWVLPIYRHYFSNSPAIPILRTTDVDFLIPNPPNITNKIDVPKILKDFDFEEQFSLIGGYTKFVHPDLEIEFLIPEIGRSKNKAVLISEFKVTAQPLRYLYFIQNHILTINYNDIKIRVPEPTVFVLFKFLLTIKRKDSDKIRKDLKTAVELTDFLMTKPNQVEKFRDIYSKMPKPWQKKLNQIISNHSPDLFAILSNTVFH